MEFASPTNRSLPLRTTLGIGCAAAALGLAPVAQAQEADSASGLGTIVVTASKKEENLQDVPISVSVIGGEEAREYGFNTAIDIVSQAPNVEAASIYGSGTSANVTMRGIGQNDFGEGHEAPITTYVDEIYLVSVPAVDFSLMDIARVEVLRGPQGTLFGRNSTGGLIHYVTARPTFVPEGYLTTSYGNFNEFRAEGAVSAPLSDKVAVRFSGLYHEADGYKKNLTPGQPDGAETGLFALRGQILFEPSSTFTALLKADYGKVDTVHNYYEAIPLGAPDPVTGLNVVDPNGTDIGGFNEAAAGAGEPNVTTADYPSHLTQEGFSGLLRMENEFDAFRLISLTSYYELDRSLSEDCDATANPLCYANFPYQTNWFTQELRAEGEGDAYRWIAGVYYLSQNARNQPEAVFNIPIDGPGQVDPVSGLYNGAFFPISLAADWEMDTESYAFFGHGEYDLSDQLTLIAGARYTHDKKDFYDADNATLRTCDPAVGDGVPSNCFLVADGGSGVANPLSASRSDDLFSWKVGLNYTPVDDVLLYASVSQGTKAGGFNNGFLADDVRVDTSLLEYGDETNVAYEVGMKTEFADNRVRLNASAFYYDYSDFQTFNFAGIGGLITNNDATFKGVEFETEFLPVDNLLIRANAAFLDTKVKDVEGRAPGYVADREAAFAPDFSASGSVAYDFDLMGDVAGRIVWDWTYVGERFTNNFNDPSSQLSAYFKHNAVVIIDVNENLSLSAYVRNISNKLNDVYSFTFTDLGYLQRQFARPRTYGASATVRF